MNSRANRLLLYGPLAAFGVFLVFWRLIWGAGESLMRDSLLEFAQAAAAQGAFVTHGALRAQGYPFYLRGSVGDFVMVSGDDRYACQTLDIDALPYAPGRFIFSCRGEQSIRVDGVSWDVIADDGRASIEKDAARGWMLKLQSGPALFKGEAAALSIRSAIVNLAPHETQGDRIDVSFRILELRAEQATRSFAVDRLDAAASVVPQRKTAEIHGVEAVIGETSLTLDGSLDYGGGGITAGRFNSTLRKPAGLVRVLSAANLIDSKEAEAAEAALAMLAVASGGSITAPIEISNGDIRLGGMVIARLGERSQP